MDSSNPVEQRNRWLAVKDVAPVLGVSDRTVRRLVSSRMIGHHIVGGQIRIRREDLDTYLWRTRVEAVS